MNEIIGKNIASYRKLKGMTQKQLADQVGVVDTAISNWENGKRTIAYESLLKIASVLETPIESLTGDSRTLPQIKEAVFQYVKIRDLQTKKHNKWILIKSVISVLFIILNIFKLIQFDILYFSFLVIFIAVILYDLSSILFPRTKYQEYHVSLGKEIKYYSRNSIIKQKRDLTERILNTFVLIISQVMVSAMFIGVMTKLEGNASITWYALFILINIVLLVVVLVLDVIKWRPKTEFDYDKFKYNLELKLTKLLVVLTQILFIFTYSVTVFYRSALSDSVLSLFIIMPPLLLISVEILYYRKLDFYDSFQIQID